MALALPGLVTAQTPPTPPVRPPVPVDSVARRDSLRDTVRVGRDTVAASADAARAPVGPRRARAAVARQEIRAPISPRRAFLYSLLVPGYGQSKLDRPAAGALFIAVEATAFVMARKSLRDLREAQRFRGDSLVPALYPVDSTVNQPQPAVTRVRNVFAGELVRARRLHFEDWIAVLAFNHLFAGAEAFVSANLWDLPTQISARRTDQGPALAVSLTW